MPPSGEADVFAASNVILGVGDPEYVQSMEDLMAAFMTLHQIAMELGEHRLANPSDDITSILMHAEVDGERLTVPEFASFFILLVVAGNETTRTAISNGMWALQNNPDQRALWASDFDPHAEDAVEEIVRWATPVIHFRRTATQDTEIAGQPIAEGEKVVMWFNSANRDERQFDDPYRFDLTRSPNPHFGYGGGGPHFCLGANLARREIRVMFERAVPRLPTSRSPRSPTGSSPRSSTASSACRARSPGRGGSTVPGMTGVEPFDPGFGPLVGTTMRVAVWNIWARYAAWELRGPIIEAQLHARPHRTSRSLVEVWEEPGGRSQAAELAAALGGYEHVYASNLTFADGVHAGNAILSRWPINALGGPHPARVKLPTDHATTRGRSGSASSPRSTAHRGPFQAFCRAPLLARGPRRDPPGAGPCDLRVRPRDPSAVVSAILGGDLNASPATDEIRMLTGDAAPPVPGIWFRDAWVHAGDGPGFTWSNTNPWAATSLDVDRRIDFVMVGHPKLGGVGQPRRAELLGDTPVDGVYGSDHFGVVTDLRY